jgi:predicted kinase
MLHKTPTLHLVCGKAASGKSTLTAQLGSQPGHVVISEDDWLAELFSDELHSIADYARCALKLQEIMGPHVAALLNAGVSVVLDFQANTIARRNWMRQIIEATQADHKLHYLDVPDAVCLERLRDRNASGEHPFAVSESQFIQLSRYFVAPTPDEGFDLVVHRQLQEP